MQKKKPVGHLAPAGGTSLGVPTATPLLAESSTTGRFRLGESQTDLVVSNDIGRSDEVRAHGAPHPAPFRRRPSTNVERARRPAPPPRVAGRLARDDVRVCVPTRERLKAEAQAPTPTSTKRARRVTESPQAPRPRPPTPPPPAPAPEPATDDDESYDEFGPGAKVVAPASDGCVYQATVVKAYKKALRVKWEDGATASAPREDCELQERAPKRPRITEEDKRERRREQQELRAMAQHDKPALLLTERRAMGMEDKTIYRALAARPAARPGAKAPPPTRRTVCGPCSRRPGPPLFVPHPTPHGCDPAARPRVQKPPGPGPRSRAPGHSPGTQRPERHIQKDRDRHSGQSAWTKYRPAPSSRKALKEILPCGSLC